MFDLEFESLAWTHAIWGVVAIGGLLVWLETRRSRRGSQFVSQKMQDRLARTTSLGSRLLSHACFLAALACLVLAQMRPQYGFAEKQFPHVGAQIMICLDVSKSMLAEDTSPNRLERAKSELEVLLNYLQDDQVGLIAFAGKATVLCPMTTDFGFLKMLLREASPTSVGRGGTLLEKPIRRAMAGFSDHSEMSKVIILITDGEDNGSKPTDAAKEAAERGIKIITIGFGDENGTKIEITHPRTGLAQYLRDWEGQEVVSRLDISTLTQIASLSDGAFIPARLGSLDVESIHQDHIAPLMRARTTRKQVVKNEAFQWPLLAGIGLFVFAVLMSNTLGFSRTRFGDWLEARSLGKVAIFFLFLTGTNPAVAQDSPSGKQPTEVDANRKQGTSSQAIGSDFTSRTLEDLVPEDPLECYNRSSDILRSDTRYAEKLLEAARRNAGHNAELRFRSSYNLGWVKINQANNDLKEKPQEALSHLQEAANWFRESVRLRPKNKLPRENLEIVLQRITELSDSLNKKDPQDLGQQLDELIQRQAVLVENSRQLLEQSSQVENKNEFSEPLVKSFRLASVDQRLLVSDLNDVSRQASQRVAEFRQQPQNSSATGKTSADQQQQLKMAQVAQALVYLDRGAQRLGQARSQLRLKNGERASLRSSLGLDELKRARDQLRDPAGILRQIIADTQLLNRQTNALLAGKNRFAAFLGNQVELPRWLDIKYLSQFQTTQGERCRELEAVLLAVASQPAAGAGQSANQDPVNDPKREMIQRAAQLVGAACLAFDAANQDLGDEKAREAEPKQRDAILNLQDAYELFADLKGLLELAYAQQREVNGSLKSGAALKGSVRSQVAEQLVREMAKNLGRIDRIEDLVTEKTNEAYQAQLNQDLESNERTAASSQGPGEVQKLEMAKKLVEQARLTSGKLKDDLVDSRENPQTSKDWKLLLDHGEQVEQQLNELRRLFFSIIEQLQETVDRQNQLNGDTDQELVRWEREKENEQTTEKVTRRMAPLKSRQDELASITERIGNTLQETAEAGKTSVPPANQANERQKQQLEMLEKYAQATKLVFEGKQAMEGASQFLGQVPVQEKEVRLNQEKALEKLVEALTLLKPSGDNQQDQEKQPNNNSQDEEEKKRNDGSKGGMDTASRQAFQGIRDREAQRRKDRQKHLFQERVEKDW